MGIILLVFKVLLAHPFLTPGQNIRPESPKEIHSIKLMFIIDIYITQEYDYFLKVRKIVNILHI
jgi:hypothetical protein